MNIKDHLGEHSFDMHEKIKSRLYSAEIKGYKWYNDGEYYKKVEVDTSALDTLFATRVMMVMFDEETWEEYYEEVLELYDLRYIYDYGIRARIEVDPLTNEVIIEPLAVSFLLDPTGEMIYRPIISIDLQDYLSSIDLSSQKLFEDAIYKQIASVLFDRTIESHSVLINRNDEQIGLFSFDEYASKIYTGSIEGKLKSYNTHELKKKISGKNLYKSQQMLYYIEDPGTGNSVEKRDSVNFTLNELDQFKIVLDVTKSEAGLRYLIKPAKFNSVFRTANGDHAVGHWHLWSDLKKVLEEHQIFLLSKGAYYATKAKLEAF